MTVTDRFVCLSIINPNRAALGIEAALSEIERGRGTFYDAEVADDCLCLFREKHYQLST